MKANVKLCGTLSRLFPGYDHSQGLEVELPEESSVKELLDVLGIPSTKGVTVVMKGRVMKDDDSVQNEEPVYILQAIQGG